MTIIILKNGEGAERAEKSSRRLSRMCAEEDLIARAKEILDKETFFS